MTNLPTPDLPTPDPPAHGRLIDARLHLLDRQVLDRDDVPVTTVDDIEISDLPGDGNAGGQPAPVIIALLSGPVLGTRIFGGRPPRSRLVTIAWRHVQRVGTTLHLHIAGETLDVAWTERWVRDRIIGRIPGGRHDPE
jgi:hypothetical protein